MVDWGEKPTFGLTVKAQDVAWTVDEYVSAQTLGAGNYFVLVDASTSSVDIALPDVLLNNKRIYMIKKKDSSGHKVNINVHDVSTESIDGETEIELKSQYAYLSILGDAINKTWHIIGGEYVKMEDTLENILEELKDTIKLSQRQILLLGKLEKHLSDEREIHFDLEDIQEGLEEEFSEVLIEDDVE